MNEITSVLLLIDIMLLGWIITFKFFYWIICLTLAVINSHAVYDNISRHTILKLAKTDKMWKDVVKILNLENKGE